MAPKIPTTDDEFTRVREDRMADPEALKYERQGGLPDESEEDPVRNSIPFKGLRGAGKTGAAAEHPPDLSTEPPWSS